MADTRPTSPWVYVAVGCGVLVLLAVAGVAALGFLGFRWAKDLERTLEDPAARREAVLEILGCEELPAGYHAMIGMSIPILMEVAMLSDRPSGPGEEPQGFDERGFIYIKMVAFGKESQELRDYFEGKTDDAAVLRQNNINIRASEIVKRGTLETEDGTLLYLVQRGSLGAFGGRHEGLTALTIVPCAGDRRTRMGIWFAPDPWEEGTQDPAALAGSPADEAAIQDFMAQFDLCR